MRLQSKRPPLCTKNKITGLQPWRDVLIVNNVPTSMGSRSEGSVGFFHDKTVVMCAAVECPKEPPGYIPGETRLLPTLLKDAARGDLLCLELCRRP